MANIRLLEVRNTYKWGGGPDKTILVSAQRHDRARVETVVAYIRDIRDHAFRIADKARARGLVFYEILERRKLDLRVLCMLREIVHRHNINLIHTHDYKSDLFGYLLRLWLRNRPVTLLSTAHAWVMLGLRGEIYRRLDLLLMRRFDHLIAVSQATKDEMTAAGIPAEKISVIHNAIDTEEWAPSQESRDLRRQWGLQDAYPIVGYVGRIMPEKDLETWLRAATLVAKQFPTAHFVLVGDGKDSTTQKDLQQLARILGIANRVHFPGYREDLLSVYATFDTFLLSSRREGLPNSILEAMAMGRPVVTTDVAGAKELVQDGQTGYVLPQGDAHGLARAIISLAGNAKLRSQMGQASRQRIEDKFSFTHRLQRIEALYEQLVTHQPHQPQPQVPGLVAQIPVRTT